MLDEQLIAEVADLLRTMPANAEELRTAAGWRGRAAAVVKQFEFSAGLTLSAALRSVDTPSILQDEHTAYRTVVSLLHEIQYSVRLRSNASTSVAFESGAVFSYFEELRKLIETAQNDILFVDPYIDSDFVARYLPHVRETTRVRLLSTHKIAALTAALSLFAKENNVQIQLRSSPNLHDRFVFLDGVTAYQSGASFKDGARKSGTTIAQIVDAFPSLKSGYEKLWADGTISPLAPTVPQSPT